MLTATERIVFRDTIKKYLLHLHDKPCILNTLNNLEASMSEKEYTLIIGAMDVEIEALKSEMSGLETIKKCATTYYKGILSGKNIVLFKSGIGKVNAAIATTIAIENFNIKNIIFTGVAGSLSNDFNIGDVVISDALVYHDFIIPDPSEDNIKECFMHPIKATQSLIEKTHAAAIATMDAEKVHIGTIATGDEFVTDRGKLNKIGEKSGAVATEMEGASVAQVATMFEKPFVVIRSISDKADGSAHLDFGQFVGIAAKNSSAIVLKLLPNI